MDTQALEFAHDLKTPIQLIASCVQLLEMELPPDSRATDYLQMLSQGTHQLQRMVRGALDGAPQSAEPAEARICDVVAQAREISRCCAFLAREKGVSLSFQCNCAAFRMRCDRQKLERILNNLLSNALRFTPRGGFVTLEALVRGDAVDFIVSDTGCGIAPRAQRAVFNRGVTRGGDGYGLSIVREYARQLGGGVSLESTPGKGSRFTVHLPVTTAAAHEKSGGRGLSPEPPNR